MTQPNSAIRCFIALETPFGVRQLLAQAIGRLREAIPGGVRWVDPTSIHLTVKFLGDVDPRRVDDLQTAMAAAAQGSPPFHLALAELGAFPNYRHPRVLWVGLAGDLQLLQGLQERVEVEANKLGFPKENRPFHPHLTLGRVREELAPSVLEQVSAALATTTLPPTDGWRVVKMHLIRSTLRPQGALYTSLGEVSLEKVLP